MKYTLVLLLAFFQISASFGFSFSLEVPSEYEIKGANLNCYRLYEDGSKMMVMNSKIQLETEDNEFFELPENTVMNEDCDLYMLYVHTKEDVEGVGHHRSFKANLYPDVMEDFASSDKLYLRETNLEVDTRSDNFIDHAIKGTGNFLEAVAIIGICAFSGCNGIFP